MLTLLHISDLHFGPPYVPRVGEALLRAAHELQPDVIVASGDFSQRAKREQFAAARAWLDRLPAAPLLTIPGNHDVPLWRVLERFLCPHRNYREAINDELNSVHRFAGAIIVSLDSTAPRRAISNGRIRRWQLDFCAEAFADAPKDAYRIVVAHHHFAPAPDYEGGEVMPKAKRAMDRFVALGVDMILGGHLHRAYIGNSLDVYTGIEKDRGIIIVQSGTSTSRRGRAREREKNSYNVIRLDERMVRITHWMFDEEIDGFSPASRHVFPRPGFRFVEPTSLAEVLSEPTERVDPDHESAEEREAAVESAQG